MATKLLVYYYILLQLHTHCRFTFSMLLIDDNMTILSAEKVVEIMNNNSVQSMLSSFGFSIRSVYMRTNQLKYTTQNDRATTTIAEEVTVDFVYIASTPVAAKLDGRLLVLLRNIIYSREFSSLHSTRVK